VPLNAGRILVAEDHPINQKYIKYLLESMGMTVTLVADGKAAVKEALSGKYQLVMMDCRMPIMDC
jgi:CheY-like chemotaxis protein